MIWQLRDRRRQSCTEASRGSETDVGPLHGLRVLEIASAAPAPFACMMLADMGADVLRIDRPVGGAPSEVAPDPELDPLGRGRESICLDLKSLTGIEVVLDLAERADILVEGFRPGVMERLGLGPDVLLARNPALIIGRMTGWGQDGPLAPRAGHDINYIGIAGALHPIGPAGEPPVVPLNLIGDFGGGGMLLTVGLLAALVERTSSGVGQVVDAAMVDGASLLLVSIRGMRDAGTWVDGREANLLDGGAPFYATYETADGGYMSVGALEPQFYRRLVQGLGIDPADLPPRMARGRWPELRIAFAAAFKARTRAEWSAIFSELDACVFPVLEMAEVPAHEHVAARSGFVPLGDTVQPAPAPRFSRTASAVRSPAPRVGEYDSEVLTRWQLDDDARDRLQAAVQLGGAQTG